MTDEYYGNTRDEIAPLLPAKADKVLEIGCSGGHTLGWLRRKYPDAKMVGVDGYEPMRPHIEANGAAAHIQDLEQGLPPLDGPFDLILALDVLEHLRWPEQTLADLVSKLSPTGTVIVSLPNVSHYTVISGLLRGRFDYTPRGIMDRTHLRFFTKETMEELLHNAGLRVRDFVVNGLQGPRARVFNTATAGVFRRYLTKQYIMAAEIDPAARRASA
jgi:2-polyprenyl-3-methyl-5-hydroxy-6-metoxy-1,4-benzoquinol methylase